MKTEHIFWPLVSYPLTVSSPTFLFYDRLLPLSAYGAFIVPTNVGSLRDPQCFVRCGLPLQIWVDSSSMS